MSSRREGLDVLTSTERTAPRWTRRRLLNILAACYGTTQAGDLDVAATAEEFGVTDATVRRWTGGKSGRIKPRMPAKRLTQLQEPPADVIERERMVANNARTVVAGLHLPHTVERLRQKQWLEPHLVAVLELPYAAGGIALRQVVMTRGTPNLVHKLHKRGAIVDFTVVPTRYHAIVLIDTVMRHVHAWRLLPSPALVRESRTQTYASDAPHFDLAVMAQNVFPDVDLQDLLQESAWTRYLDKEKDPKNDTASVQPDGGDPEDAQPGDDAGGDR